MNLDDVRAAGYNASESNGYTSCIREAELPAGFELAPTCTEVNDDDVTLDHKGVWIPARQIWSSGAYTYPDSILVARRKTGTTEAPEQLSAEEKTEGDRLMRFFFGS